MKPLPVPRGASLALLRVIAALSRTPSTLPERDAWVPTQSSQQTVPTAPRARPP